MSYNPYDPPRSNEAGLPTPAIVAGQRQPWDLGDVLGKAWEIFSLHWGVLVFAPIVAGFFVLTPSSVAIGVGMQTLLRRPEILNDPFAIVALMSGPWWNGGTLLGHVVASFFAVGLVRINVIAARGGTPTFADLFGGGAKFLPMLGLRILLFILYGFGFFLLVAPFLVLYCGSWASQYFLVDAELGVFESIGASWTATSGQKMDLFVFFLVAVVIDIAGACFCGVGLLVTVPITSLAATIIFLRISGRGPAAPPIMVTPGEYPPGYGPPGGGYGGPPQGPPPIGGGYGGPPQGGPPPGYLP